MAKKITKEQKEAKFRNLAQKKASGKALTTAEKDFINSYDDAGSRKLWTNLQKEYSSPQTNVNTGNPANSGSSGGTVDNSGGTGSGAGGTGSGAGGTGRDSPPVDKNVQIVEYLKEKARNGTLTNKEAEAYLTSQNPNWRNDPALKQTVSDMMGANALGTLFGGDPNVIKDVTIDPALTQAQGNITNQLGALAGMDPNNTAGYAGNITPDIQKVLDGLVAEAETAGKVPQELLDIKEKLKNKAATAGNITDEMSGILADIQDYANKAGVRSPEMTKALGNLDTLYGEAGKRSDDVSKNLQEMDQLVADSKVRSGDLTDTITRLKTGLDGYLAPELTAFRESAARVARRAKATAMAKLADAQAINRVSGAAAASQASRIDRDYMNKQQELEQDLFVKNVDTRQKNNMDFAKLMDDIESGEFTRRNDALKLQAGTLDTVEKKEWDQRTGAAEAVRKGYSDAEKEEFDQRDKALKTNYDARSGAEKDAFDRGVKADDAYADFATDQDKEFYDRQIDANARRDNAVLTTNNTLYNRGQDARQQYRDYIGGLVNQDVSIKTGQNSTAAQREAIRAGNLGFGNIIGSTRNLQKAEKA